MKKTTAILAALLFTLLSACSASVDTSSKDALPQADSGTSATTKAAKKASTPKANTCDVAREAILTGTPKQIAAALKKLQADKTADATAREYARYYLVRDKGDKDMQEMDISLIQTACAL